MVQQVYQPNIGRVVNNALTIRAQQKAEERQGMENALMRQKMESQRRLGQDLPAAVQGDENALARIYGYAPEQAMGAQKFRQGQQQYDMDVAKQKAGVVSGIIETLEMASPEQRSTLYQRSLPALQEAAPGAAFPPDYSDAFLAEARAEIAALGGEVPDLFQPKAAPTRTRTLGDQEVQEELTAQGWQRIGGGPRFKPDKPEKVTTKGAFNSETNQLQFATEAEIQASGGTLQPIPTGLKLQSDGQGGFTLVTGSVGAAGAGDLTPTTKTNLQQKQINAAEGLARIHQIRASFKPEYLEIGTRLNTAWAAGKEKLGFKLSESDEAVLSDFSTFQRLAIENINTYIKEITGAQMSEAEANRIRKAAPDAGEGVFDGDSPTEFKSKMDDVTKQLTFAAARHSFALKQGLDPMSYAAQTPLETMPEVIEQQGAQIEQQVRAASPELDDAAVRAEVKARLQAVFGMGGGEGGGGNSGGGSISGSGGSRSGAPFDPEGANYDDTRARAAGMTPAGPEAGENQGHMGSVAETTPEEQRRYGLPAESYILLKGHSHPTWSKAVEAEVARGFEVVKRGDRYFSVPAAR
jgi:hypothetical protein